MINDYRFYRVTIGCISSMLERSYKVIALEPDMAINIAIKVAEKDSWPLPVSLAAVDISLADNRVKN